MPDDPERNRSQQQLLDDYFNNSQRWKNIYYSQDLYDTIYQQRFSAVVSLLEQTALQPESRVLEIGCGPGVTTLALARLGCLVYAVDTVETMVESMRQTVDDASLGHRVRGCLGDIHRAPFSDNCFDAVVVVGVLEWLNTWDQPFREIARVMRPFGSFIGIANNAWALHRVLDPRLSPLLQPVKRIVRTLGNSSSLVEHFHSAREVQVELNKAGLCVTACTTVGFGPFSLFGFPLFRDWIGLRLHARLQRWADSVFRY